MITIDELNTLLFRRVQSSLSALNTPLKGGVYKEQIPAESIEKECVIINTLSIPYYTEPTIFVTSYVSLNVPMNYIKTPQIYTPNYQRETQLTHAIMEAIETKFLNNANVWIEDISKTESTEAHMRTLIFKVKWNILHKNINIEYYG